MKIPGPVIAILLIVVLLFCCTSGLGLQGSLNLVTFDSAQDLMSGDLFNFLRPRVGVRDIASAPACLMTSGTGDDRALVEIALTGSGTCQFVILPADADVRTLPLTWIAGAVRVTYTPAAPDDASAVQITDRVMSAAENARTLNVSASQGGGQVRIQCDDACRIEIG
ncbi:MAG: hypothetical protein SF162_11660 [bacterium]|nr:hypothetical protein [bacterium]